MNKQEYLESIRSRISAMPADDVNRFMDYYSEMIDDRVEDGLSEEEAVADMGSPDAAVKISRLQSLRRRRSSQSTSSRHGRSYS